MGLVVTSGLVPVSVFEGVSTMVAASVLASAWVFTRPAVWRTVAISALVSTADLPVALASASMVFNVLASALPAFKPAVFKIETMSVLLSAAAATLLASVVIGVSAAFSPVKSPIVKGLPSLAVPITTSG